MNEKISTGKYDCLFRPILGGKSVEGNESTGENSEVTPSGIINKEIAPEIPENKSSLQVAYKRQSEFTGNLHNPDALLKNLLLDIGSRSFQEAGHLEELITPTERVQVVVTVQHVLEVAKKNVWPLVRFEDSYYIFNGSFWVKTNDDDLAQFLGKSAEKIQVDRFTAKHFSFRKNLVRQFHSAGYFPTPTFDPNTVMVNLKNGTFVITKERQFLKPFDQADFLRYQLSFAYDEGATCPRFEKFLDRVLPDKGKQMVLQEFLGYIFTRNSVLKLEKTMVLFGAGMNGKSVIFDVVLALLGAENVTNFSLATLTNGTGYQRATLSGKLLNYASEISAQMDTTLFKQLMSGEPVEARQIYGKPFILKDYCRFMFNTNQLPVDVENNHAFFRRFLIIHFEETITPDERDPNLATFLIENELPGIFNWVLQGLRRLLDQGDFTSTPAVNDILEKFKKESDPICLFLEDSNFQKSLDTTIALKALFDTYQQYAKDCKYPPGSLKTFAERLRSLGFNIVRKSTGRVVYIEKESLEKSDTVDTSGTMPVADDRNVAVIKNNNHSF